jgi:tetratricopeptide (TPR) repeat protein
MRILSFVAAVGCLCVPSLGSAQEATGQEAESEPSSGSQERARGLFMAGRAAIEEGDYEGAYRYFLESYELSQRPELLFNIANAAERLRRDDEAVRYYRQYLEESPDADNRAYVNGRIRALEASLPDEEDAGEEESDTAEEAAAPPAPRPSSGGDGGATMGWAIFGVGAGVAIVGAILVGVSAGERSAVDNAPDGSPWTAYEGSHELANALAPAGGVLLGVGVVAAVAGIVIAVTASPSRTEQVSLRVSPTSVALAGRFE